MSSRLLRYAMIILGLLLFAIASVGALVLVLDTDRGRTFACEKAFGAVNEAIPGTIVADCASLTPRRLRLESVEILDPEGREIAHAEAIEAEPNWPAMLTGVIGIASVHGTAPRLRLVEYGPDLAIVAAFVAPDEQDEDEEESSIEVVIDAIIVESGVLTDLPSGFFLEEIRGNASLAVREAVTVEVEGLETEVRRGSDPWVHVLDGSGDLRFGQDAEVDVAMTLEAEHEQGELDARFEGAAERFSVDATLEGLGGRLTVAGHHVDGKLEADLESKNLNLGKTSLLRSGILNGKVRSVARFAGSAPTPARLREVSIDGGLELSSVEWEELRAKTLQVDTRIEGRMPTPNGRVAVVASGVAIEDGSLEKLELTITGTDGRYAVEGRAPLPNGWILGTDLQARVDWPVLSAGGTAMVEKSPWSPLSAQLSDVQVEVGHRLSVGSLSVDGEGLRTSARGSYTFEGEADVSFRATSIDLGRIANAFDLGIGLSGTLVGSGSLRGTRERPRLAGTFEVEDGTLEELSIASLEGRLAYDAEASARLMIDAALRDGGSIMLRTKADLGRAPTLSKALRRARYDARFVAENVPLDAIGDLVEGIPPLAGSLSSEAVAVGRLDAPEIEIVAYGRGVSTSTIPPTDVHLSTTLEDHGLSVGVKTETETGGSAQASAEARVDVGALLRGAKLTAVAESPWKLSLQIPEQRWSALPTGVALSSPARVSLDFHATGGRGPITADLDADLKMPRRTASVEPHPDCTATEPARLRATIRLREERTKVELEGWVAKKSVARGTAGMETRLLAWARDGWPSTWPAATVDVEVDPIALSTVPVLCDHIAGELQGKLDAAELFRASQRISLEAELRDLRYGDVLPLDARVEAEGSATGITARARVLADDRELTKLYAHVPIDLRSPPVPLALGTGEISASADFDEAPLSVLLAPLPWIARPSGTLNGNLSAVGDAQDLSTVEAQGAVRLAGASMTIEEPFLRLDDVDADLRLEPGRLVVKSLSAHDRGGRIEAEGSLALADWKPGELEFTLEGERFPLRRAGVLMARFNGRAELTGDLGSDPRSLRLVLGQEVSLVLPEDLDLAGIQDLAQHPLVIYRGQPGFDRSLDVRAALREHREGEEEEDDRPMIVRLRSTEPFWVRRPDFSLQLDVDVNIHSEKQLTWLVGSVDIRRGFLALLNKNFDVESGSIQFTGATPVNPTLDLRAKHRLSSGYSVTVEVEGSLSDPELTFSSDAPNANTDADVIGLLLGTNRPSTASNQANDQTRSVFGGLTAGLVGSVARRELGQYAPIIAVDSEGTLDTTSVRAGFNVGDVIPEAWQDVILGVYIEGLLAGSEQGPRGGLLIELLFPHHLSTTTTYEQPDNWSLDVIWQP